MVEQFGKLLAQEGADDGRRCLVAAQAVGIGGTHDRGFQESVVAIYCHQRLYDERHEAQVLLWCLPWCMQQYAVVSRQTPVVVLTAAVDAVEGLFM